MFPLPLYNGWETYCRSEIMLTYRFFEAERSAARSEQAFDWPEGRGPRGEAGQGGAVPGHVCYVAGMHCSGWL